MHYVCLIAQVRKTMIILLFNVLGKFKRTFIAYSFVGVLFEHVLPNELDWVLGSLLCQFFKGLNELRHDIGIQVLADG